LIVSQSLNSAPANLHIDISKNANKAFQPQRSCKEPYAHLPGYLIGAHFFVTMTTAPPSELALSIAPSPTSTPMPRDVSPKSNAALIPWDPDSPEHHVRLQLQRKACGWKYDPSWTDKWAKLQREGKIALQWVVCVFHHFSVICMILIEVGLHRRRSRQRRETRSTLRSLSIRALPHLRHSDHIRRLLTQTYKQSLHSSRPHLT
jgi:hypothetical protein